MSSSPRIFVFKMREIIYTLLLVFLVILLIFCLVFMFSKKKSTPASETNEQVIQTGLYVPGVYTSPVTLGNTALDVEVTVSSDQIHSVRLVNLSESVEASFPLVSPAMDHISTQILAKQSLEGITCPGEQRYTAQLLLTAVNEALKTAQQK